MSDTTRTPQPSTPGEDRPQLGGDRPRHFFKWAAVATIIAGVATVIGVKAFAGGVGHCGWHRAGFMGGPVDPARIDEHLDRMLKHFYVEIDATDAQKQQLAPIVKSAARDLLPVRAQIHDARRKVVELLSRESIDRGALETLRDDQFRLVEQASRRLSQALADIADVLTPDQRRQLAERIDRWHGRHG